MWTEPTVRRPERVTGSPRERPLGLSTSGAIRHTGAVQTRRGKFGLTVELRPPSTACGRETAASRSRAAGPTTGDTNTSGRHPSRGRRVRTYTRSVAGYPADRGVRLAVEADGGQKTARTGDSPGRSDTVSRRRPAIPLAERNRRLARRRLSGWSRRRIPGLDRGYGALAGEARADIPSGPHWHGRHSSVSEWGASRRGCPVRGQEPPGSGREKGGKRRLPGAVRESLSPGRIEASSMVLGGLVPTTPLTRLIRGV